MKPVFCRILKAPKSGDDLRLCVTEPRGGRTDACHLVNHNDLWRPLKEGEAIGDRENYTSQYYDDAAEALVQTTYVKFSDKEACENVAKGLAQTIGSQWDGEMFKAHARKDEIVIVCQMDRHRFLPELNGTEAAGKEVIEIEQ